MQTSSLALANTFIDRYGRSSGIQHMKLQKLAYYCHSWWLTYNEKSFLVEKPEVWQYGPVFSEMYRSLKGFGSHYISEPVTFFPDRPASKIAEDNTDMMRFVDWIWGNYGAYSAAELSERTHAKGTPWRIIAEEHDFRVPRHTAIEDKIIKECFRGNYLEVLKKQ